MININNIYQTVQALINKDNRGYLPAKSFNKFAQQAQLKLFDGYFSDSAHFNASQKGYDGSIEASIEEKVNVFRANANFSTDATAVNSIRLDSGRFLLPENLYMLKEVYYTLNGETFQVELIPQKGRQYILNSPWTGPSTREPKYERYNSSEAGIGNIRVYPATIVDGVSVDYIKRPSNPRWGYVTPGSPQASALYPELDYLDDDTDALYDPQDTPPVDSMGDPTGEQTPTVHFELHPSEQYKLVEQILEYAGIEIREGDIATFAENEQQATEAKMKN